VRTRTCLNCVKQNNCAVFILKLFLRLFIFSCRGGDWKKKGWNFSRCNDDDDICSDSSSGRLDRVGSARRERDSRPAAGILHARSNIKRKKTKFIYLFLKKGEKFRVRIKTRNFLICADLILFYFILFYLKKIRLPWVKIVSTFQTIWAWRTF
jgi:hypothetical protein